MRMTSQPEGEYQSYLEFGYEGRWILAHTLILLGCVTKGEFELDVQEKARDDVERYLTFLRKYGEEISDFPPPRRIVVAERFYTRNEGGYEINATFAPDKTPLSSVEITQYLRWHSYARAELFHLLAGIPKEVYVWRPEKGKRCLRETLEHIAGAELWYVTRLDETPSSSLYNTQPADAVERLHYSQKILISRFQGLPDSRTGVERVHSGEIWTPRKVLRRALEHQQEHLNSIRLLLGQYMV